MWALYLLCWALTPCVFFTLAGNILWAYVLPGMPALALWLASYLTRFPQQRVEKLLMLGMTITALSFAGVLVGLNGSDRLPYKSAKALIAAYESVRKGTEPLVIVGGRRLYSAAFYSAGTAERVADTDQLVTRLMQGPVVVAIENEQIKQLPEAVRRTLKPVGQYGKFVLLILKSRPTDAKGPAAAPP